MNFEQWKKELEKNKPDYGSYVFPDYLKEYSDKIVFVDQPVTQEYYLVSRKGTHKEFKEEIENSSKIYLGSIVRVFFRSPNTYDFEESLIFRYAKK